MYLLHVVFRPNKQRSFKPLLLLLVMTMMTMASTV